MNCQTLITDVLPSQDFELETRIRRGSKIPSANMLKKYWDTFFIALSESGEHLTFEELREGYFGSSSVKGSTIENHLRDFLDAYKDRLGKISGVFPHSETILDLVEEELGEPIRSGNIVKSNEIAKRIVDDLEKPRHELFCTSRLQKYLTPLSEEFCIPGEVLFRFCYEDYQSFASESGNGIVSRAGTINELILVRALEAEGLELGENKDFTHKGKSREGDIVINSPKTSHALRCEVKSYHARERLLRALEELKGELNLGIGWFQNPQEFTRKRTTAYITANTHAIYLPARTLERLPEGSKDRLNATGEQPFYRDIEELPGDAAYFSKTGEAA